MAAGRSVDSWSRVNVLLMREDTLVWRMSCRAIPYSSLWCCKLVMVGTFDGRVYFQAVGSEVSRLAYNIEVIGESGHRRSPHA